MNNPRSYSSGIVLTPSQRAQLDLLLHQGEAPVRVIKRAQALSALDKGNPPSVIAGILGFTEMSVYRIKRKFQKGGLSSALFEPSHPRRKKFIDIRQAVSILAMVCESPPEGRARWTVRLVTSEVMKRGIMKKISREPIRRLLHEGQLKPWREKNVVHQENDTQVRDQDGRSTEPVRTPVES